MNMLRWFRRTRPTPPAERVETGELLTAWYWNYTPEQWRRLPDARRRYCRENVVHADRFQA